MSAAQGGQTLISAAARALLDDRLPLRDLGAHRLKDLGAPERLFQLGEGTFAPPRVLGATNLPIAPTPLLGREEELRELASLLRNGSRLVTVTGPGGTGKTRLALQAAAELAGDFDDGVHWVSLGGLADPQLVVAEIAQAVGAQDDVPGFLRARDVMLLLDNFEHVMAAAPAIAELLSLSDRVRMLVTSRAPLRISGEHVFLLEPLAPAAAAALFSERAEAAGGRPAGAETVTAICRRLDGLPLAIELAAARTSIVRP